MGEILKNILWGPEAPEEEKPGLLDKAASGVGLCLQGTGYCVGRVSPKIERMARAVARTETAKFVAAHFGEGFTKGREACIRAEAEAHARAIIATGVRGAKEIAAQFMADVTTLFRGKEAV